MAAIAVRAWRTTANAEKTGRADERPAGRSAILRVFVDGVIVVALSLREVANTFTRFTPAPAALTNLRISFDSTLRPTPSSFQLVHPF